MRRAQKRQAEEYAELFDQAHKEIKKAIERKLTETAADLLGQCQQRAIELGNMIEEEEGEDFPTVHMLEDYCESLYRLHEKLLWDSSVNERKEYKFLQKSLVRIKDSIRDDIPVRMEAVFLPYKASMWDSLESVWRAAAEDPACDAYVIPIPYYDRNPDGSLGELRYEGELYPPDVPVMRYEGYDFEKRRPDMIFIHNFYDDRNYVTSVHPFFYTKNLKRFTEQLIYIPYFVLGEIDPGNKQAVKDMEHFCTVPGMFYADRVIVQSENMRQIYINVMTEITGEERRSYWEKKILGLGSPKLDKVQSADREEAGIPEDWEEIIRKPDGSRKKVVLYNTGVSGILNHGERMLEKIKSVLHIFRSCQDEVALLWRPHPLTQATIRNARPELLGAYEEITAQYRAEGFGIYDDTAELDRAIALSDAYYGDWSSVVQLCRSVGMPVMIQDVGTV